MSMAPDPNHLDLYGEAVFSWLRRKDRLHWLTYTDWPAELVSMLRRELPGVYRCLDTFTEEQESYVWQYARARNLVHDLTRSRLASRKETP